MIKIKEQSMIKINKCKFYSNVLFYLSTISLFFSVNAWSHELPLGKVHDAKKSGLVLEGHVKLSSSIDLDFSLPDSVSVDQEVTLKTVIGSEVKKTGQMLVRIKADDGLTILSNNLLNIDFSDRKVSNDVLFRADAEGLYYLTIGVIQLDENEDHVQAENFVVPIQVGISEYAGKTSTIQSKANNKLFETGTDNGRKIIEMIAE